jgi:hypothetical protein
MPYEPYLGKEGAYDCIEYYPDEDGVFDGILDLTLHFKAQEVIAALGDVSDGEVLVLELGGNLREEFHGGPFVGEDVVVVLKKGKD